MVPNAAFPRATGSVMDRPVSDEVLDLTRTRDDRELNSDERVWSLQKLE
jgi:hypothetical protein